MTLRIRIVVAGIAASLLASYSFAQLSVGRATATVQVVTVPPDSAAGFVFTGVVSGNVAAGDTIQATGLLAGEFTATQLDPAPDYVITAISCDDAGGATPSTGNLATKTAVFNLEAGESVTCVFTNTASRLVSQGGSGSAGSGSTANVNPFEIPDDDLENFPIPDGLPPSAGTFAAPKAGPWNVQNFAGQMNCGGFVVPLTPARGRGQLEVLDNGRTVIGTGFSEGTAPLRMTAFPGITGRYAGNVGGQQDGIPMIIAFRWQLITDEWITGYLSSTVSQQGISCNMFRMFELEYAGP